MHELVSRSMLPSLTLDISDNKISAAVAQVADWVERSGGLYMPTNKNVGLNLLGAGPAVL